MRAELIYYRQAMNLKRQEVCTQFYLGLFRELSCFYLGILGLDLLLQLNAQQLNFDFQVALQLLSLHPKLTKILSPKQKWAFSYPISKFRNADEKKLFQRTFKQTLILQDLTETQTSSYNEYFQNDKNREFDYLQQKNCSLELLLQIDQSKNRLFLIESAFNSLIKLEMSENSAPKSLKTLKLAFLILFINTLMHKTLLQQSQMKYSEENLSKENMPVGWDQDSEQPSSIQQGEKLTSSDDTISNEAFFQAKNRLITFVQSLGQFRKTQLRSDVLEHCACLNKTRKVIPNYISDETILKMTTARIQKMIKNKRVKKNWSQEDVKILVWILSKYSDTHGILDLHKDLQLQDWEFIASLIPGVSSQCCMFKWLSLKKINLSCKNWEQYQSNLLKELIESQLFSTKKNTSTINWKLISQKLFWKNEQSNKVFRNAKQCRQHWCCFLNPQLKKGPWKIQEDILLLTKIRSNNGRKWSEIVSYFDGRTQNALKNRFTLLIQKQKKISKSKQQKSLIEDCLQLLLDSQAKITKQKRAIFLTQILSQQKKQQKEPNNYSGIEGSTFYDILECSKLENEENAESIQTPKSGQMTIRFEFNFDLLKQMAISKQMRPGCVKNGNFEPQF